LSCKRRGGGSCPLASASPSWEPRSRSSILASTRSPTHDCATRPAAQGSFFIRPFANAIRYTYTQHTSHTFPTHSYISPIIHFQLVIFMSIPLCSSTHFVSTDSGMVLAENITKE